jgi:hypothetical protein
VLGAVVVVEQLVLQDTFTVQAEEEAVLALICCGLHLIYPQP